jgi:hypothetical protein
MEIIAKKAEEATKTIFELTSKDKAIGSDEIVAK